MKQDNKTKRMVQFSILLAILAIFCFTPLGTIPMGGPVVATLGMLPVIVTAFMLGTKAGAFMGGVAGLFSFIVMSFIAPTPTSFIFTPLVAPGNFWSLLICFVPRILVGVVAGALHNLLSKKATNVWVRYGIPAMLASLTNTVLVLGGAALAFGHIINSDFGMLAMVFIGSSILTNGLPEAAVSFLVGTAIGKALKVRR